MQQFHLIPVAPPQLVKLPVNIQAPLNQNPYLGQELQVHYQPYQHRLPKTEQLRILR